MYAWCIYLLFLTLHPDACMYDALMYDAHIYDSVPWSWWCMNLGRCMYIWCGTFWGPTDQRTNKAILGVGCNMHPPFWKVQWRTVNCSPAPLTRLIGRAPSPPSCSLPLPDCSRGIAAHPAADLLVSFSASCLLFQEPKDFPHTLFVLSLVRSRVRFWVGKSRKKVLRKVLNKVLKKVLKLKSPQKSAQKSTQKSAQTKKFSKKCSKKYSKQCSN